MPYQPNRAVGNVNVRQDINCNSGIMDIATWQLEIDRISKTIYNGMNLRRLTAATGANKLVKFAVYSPFFALALCGCAFTTVESRERFSISAS